MFCDDDDDDDDDVCARSSAVFYPSAPATGPVVDSSSLSNIIYYYDPVSAAVYSTLPALPGYDVTNSAYLYAGGGLSLVTSSGYGVQAGHSGSSSGGQCLTTHYLQRLA